MKKILTILFILPFFCTAQTDIGASRKHITQILEKNKVKYEVSPDSIKPEEYISYFPDPTLKAFLYFVSDTVVATRTIGDRKNKKIINKTWQAYNENFDYAGGDSNGSTWMDHTADGNFLYSIEFPKDNKTIFINTIQKAR
jgi:predicted aminopeptidase